MEIWYLFVKNYAVSVIIIHQVILVILLFLLKSAYANYPGYLENNFKAGHKYINYFQMYVKSKVHNLVK